MWEDLAGRMISFAGGVLLGAFISGLIWIRNVMVQNAELRKQQKHLMEVSTRHLASYETLNRDKIREEEDEIGKTQRIVRSRAMGA